MFADQAGRWGEWDQRTKNGRNERSERLTFRCAKSSGRRGMLHFFPWVGLSEQEKPPASRRNLEPQYLWTDKFDAVQIRGFWGSKMVSVPVGSWLFSSVKQRINATAVKKLKVSFGDCSSASQLRMSLLCLWLCYLRDFWFEEREMSFAWRMCGRFYASKLLAQFLANLQSCLNESGKSVILEMTWTRLALS